MCKGSMQRSIPPISGSAVQVPLQEYTLNVHGSVCSEELAALKQRIAQLEVDRDRTLGCLETLSELVDRLVTLVKQS